MTYITVIGYIYIFQCLFLWYHYVSILYYIQSNKFKSLTIGAQAGFAYLYSNISKIAENYVNMSNNKSIFEYYEVIISFRAWSSTSLIKPLRLYSISSHPDQNYHPIMLKERFLIFIYRKCLLFGRFILIFV